MRGISSALLGLRALQATRRLHLPTYVATRFLLESVAGSSDSSWARAVISRKYPSRKLARVQETVKFKRLGDKQEAIYRDFIALSPTTSVAEALVLANLASSRAFKKHASVYSYLWPRRPQAPYNFENYVEGYRRRNIDIAARVAEQDNAVLVVSDIRRFYPSIIRSSAKVRFNRSLRASRLDKEVKDTASALLEHLFEAAPGRRGIATGPELSHVIGDLALATVDAALHERFPQSYFRYVDDIVVAVPAAEADHAMSVLQESVSREDLTINAAKMDVVSGSEWLAYGPHNLQGVKTDSFEALVFLIKVYLSRNRNGELTLAEELRSEGFSIPLERLAATGRANSFGQRLRWLMSKRWLVSINAITATEKDILTRAKIVRLRINNELHEALSTDVPIGSTRRRWFIQRLRYLTNRAVYLFPAEDLRFLLNPLRTYPEFAETVALIEMLVGESVENILQFPGPALTAGAGFFKHHGRKVQSLPDAKKADQTVVDALSILLLFDVVEQDTRSLADLDGSRKALLNFCAGQSDAGRLYDDFSYTDEISCLGLGRSREDSIRVIDTRFSDGEGVVLDALDIGAAYAY